MAVVAERFVLREPTAAQGDARVGQNNFAILGFNPDITTNEERPVWLNRDGVHGVGRFFRAAIVATEMQRTRRASHDNVGCRARLGLGGVNPRLSFRIKHFRSALNTFSGMDAPLDVVLDVNIRGRIGVEIGHFDERWLGDSADVNIAKFQPSASRTGRPVEERDPQKPMPSALKSRPPWTVIEGTTTQSVSRNASVGL